MKEFKISNELLTRLRQPNHDRFEVYKKEGMIQKCTSINELILLGEEGNYIPDCDMVRILSRYIYYEVRGNK